MTDYRLIYGFNPNMSTLYHDKTVKGLCDVLDTHGPHHKWIVMSHHMPSFDLIDPKYLSDKFSDMNHAFATNIAVAQDPRIVAWVYGHTHTPLQRDKFYCNPIGYPGENTKWDLTKEFEIIA